MSVYHLYVSHESDPDLMILYNTFNCLSLMTFRSSCREISQKKIGGDGSKKGTEREGGGGGNLPEKGSEEES